MFSLMNKFRKARRNKKGFTLIELIVVIAILGILALIAIPRFAGIRGEATVKSEAATAEEIITALRVFETNNNLSGAATITNAETLITIPTAPGFSVTGGGASAYVISWTGQGTGFTGTQTLTEGDPFTPNPDA